MERLKTTKGTQDVLVCLGNDLSFKSNLICAVTGGTLPHAWIEFSDTWGGRWVAHANNRGVVVEHSLSVHRRYPVRKAFRCKVDLGRGLLAVRKYVGRADYDYGALWNALIFVIYRPTQWRFLEGFASWNTRKFSCTEFVALILRQSGVPGLEQLEPKLTAPGVLEEFITSHPDIFQLVEQRTLEDSRSTTTTVPSEWSKPGFLSTHSVTERVACNEVKRSISSNADALLFRTHTTG